jgi:hypothetical protein
MSSFSDSAAAGIQALLDHFPMIQDLVDVIYTRAEPSESRDRKLELGDSIVQWVVDKSVASGGKYSSSWQRAIKETTLSRLSEINHREENWRRRGEDLDLGVPLCREQRHLLQSSLS